MERKGVEPSTSALRTQPPRVVTDTDKGFTSTPKAGCTSGCTSEGQNEKVAESLPPELALVVNRWPTLPDALRAGILAMVKAAE